MGKVVEWVKVWPMWAKYLAVFAVGLVLGSVAIGVRSARQLGAARAEYAANARRLTDLNDSWAIAARTSEEHANAAREYADAAGESIVRAEAAARVAWSESQRIGEQYRELVRSVADAESGAGELAEGAGEATRLARDALDLVGRAIETVRNGAAGSK